MRNWNTGGLSLSRPKQEQQNSVWQYLIRISNLPKRVTHTDVLPCTLISDHDASYVFYFFLINIYPGASNLAELVKWSHDTT